MAARRFRPEQALVTVGRVYDLIVLAGGAARRLGGADKPALEIGGMSLLDRVLDAATHAGRTVVVGPERPVACPERVVWRQEEPAGGGPVAAIAAGFPETRASTLLVLAADLPWIGGGVDPLLTALSGAAGGVALLTDESGHPNYLAGSWRRATLGAALDAVGAAAGSSMRALVAAAGGLPVLVADEGGWGRDCDTWDDLDDARLRAGALETADREGS